MSINVARRKRTYLYLCIVGLLLMVAAISAISARDPDGVMLRVGMIFVTVGAAMWLPWQALLPAALVIWLGPNVGRSTMDDYELFNGNMLWELPGIVGLSAFSAASRFFLRELEEEHLLLGLNGEAAMGLDPETGVYDEGQLRISIEAELARSRRFGRSFALVLVGIDEMRQRFDYRDESLWLRSFAATAELLRGTRHNVDRVYRYGSAGFAMVLPESGPGDVNGLVRRLRRVARKARPAEGEPGGPLPAYFGATFFPACATSTDDLLRRAEIALRIADKNANRVQLDGAEAPEMPPLETLRQPDEEVGTAVEEAVTQEPIPLPITIAETPATAPFQLPDQSAAAQSPQPLFAAQDEAIEVDEEPPFEVYALHAPEPAIDELELSWQSEAPLSVLPKPNPRPLLIAMSTETSKPAKMDAIDSSVSDALKRLDETLDLIRSLRQQRSA